MNCSFWDNYCASAPGGAMALEWPALAAVTNCTVVNNNGAYGGAGIWDYYATLNISNSIIWGNYSDDEYHPNIYYALPSYVKNRCSDIHGCGGSDDIGGDWDTDFGVDLDGNKDANPQFAGYPNMVLDEDSPCIDAGDNELIQEFVDLTGWWRKIDGDNDGVTVVDMGAYEYGFTSYCGGVEILDVEYNQSGITDLVNCGWQDETLTASCGSSFVISDTFWVEDSAGYCGGDNSATQSGTCDIWIYLPSAKTITFSVEGVVEKQNPEKDFGEIYLDESSSPIVIIKSTLSGGYCTMDELKIDSETLSPLSEGVHHIQFKVDTDDGFYHDDVYFTFTVTIQNP